MSLPGPLIAIVGPTASGKSALAERIACQLGSPVVSVDAMQVYRGMDIGTAKTPPARRACPLLMVDVAEVGEPYSVSIFQHDGRAVIDRILIEGKTPVLCGGTGLYLNALVDEMNFPTGETGGESRRRYEEFARERGSQALYEVLLDRDPESAALIHPNNVRRVVRALELADEGKSYAREHEGLHKRAPHYDCRIWGIERDRAELYGRIDDRVDEMFDDGLVDEIKGLCERGLASSLTASQAIGYKEVVAYLNGDCTAEEARETIKRRSRNYAKRQISWFRHDSRVRWIDCDSVTDEEATRLVLEDLKEHADGTL
ncbi:MAG: tRNA (adenosine(37)-N6)-dimethylallyltransferase MiaA [Olegusella sp.]|nr:tRNA (adenosine(37)-N6)-dimethylallyltransferase MiaA [Olegusella sp.]